MKDMPTAVAHKLHVACIELPRLWIRLAWYCWVWKRGGGWLAVRYPDNPESTIS